MFKQSLQQKLSQKLSPQQIQLMKLIQLSTIEFEQNVLRELEENPALDNSNNETDQNDFSESDDFNDSSIIDADSINIDEYLSDDETPSYKLNTNNTSKDNDDDTVPYAAGKSFGEYLLEQISNFNLDDESLYIAEYIIGSIDQSGYLRRDILDIIDDLAFNQGIYIDEKKFADILNTVQKLDPVGVGARNLQECLSLQLDAKENSFELKIAKEIINNNFDEFSKKHFGKIIESLEVDASSVKLAYEIISGLNPKPGGAFDSIKHTEQIIPDFEIIIENEVLILTLNGRNAPTLNISTSYKNLFETYDKDKSKDKNLNDAVIFIKQKLDSAKWFIDSIKQRRDTLFNTMNVIMQLQEAYFFTGDDSDLKPMILKDVADIVKLDISTISRVVNSKYVSTPFGTFLLKSFFTDSTINDSGDTISTREIKSSLRDIVDGEDKNKPYSDIVLVEKLKEKGYSLARRTVAKYRKELGLPVASLRKEITI